MIDLPDGEYAAVLDRFEAERAVLVLEADGEDVAEVAVHRTWLPPAGRTRDAVVAVTVEDGRPVAVEHDPEETASRGEAAQDRFDNLARRPPGEDGDEDGDGEG